MTHLYQQGLKGRTAGEIFLSLEYSLGYLHKEPDVPLVAIRAVWDGKDVVGANHPEARELFKVAYSSGVIFDAADFRPTKLMSRHEAFTRFPGLKMVAVSLCNEHEDQIHLFKMAGEGPLSGAMKQLAAQNLK